MSKISILLFSLLLSTIQPLAAVSIRDLPPVGTGPSNLPPGTPSQIPQLYYQIGPLGSGISTGGLLPFGSIDSSVETLEATSAIANALETLSSNVEEALSQNPYTITSSQTFGNLYQLYTTDGSDNIDGAMNVLKINLQGNQDLAATYSQAFYNQMLSNGYYAVCILFYNSEGWTGKILAAFAPSTTDFDFGSAVESC